MLIDVFTSVWVWLGSLFLALGILGGVLAAKVEDLERKVRRLEHPQPTDADDDVS